MNAAIATAVGGIDLSNYYERAETYSQAEVNSVVSGAIDALNITQHRTESQVSTAISDALAPSYTASEVDAAIASNSFNAADYFTRTQSDSRYFPNNANPGNAEVFTLVRDSVSIPRQIRGILPRAPLAWSYLLSGTITELRCDAYSKAEADGRYLSSTGYTGTLDGRYLVTNANAGSSEVFTIIRDANAVPRQLRGILPRAPLGWSHILSGTVTELEQDRGGRALCHSGSDLGRGLARHGPGELWRGSGRHILHQPHSQQRGEHSEFHRHGQHHRSGCAFHSGCADAPAEAHQRGGRSPAHRSRPREHQDGG